MQGDKTLLSCNVIRAKNRRYFFEKTKYSKLPYGPFLLVTLPHTDYGSLKKNLPKK
jgi:hypothetical protein